ncbi:hypothetical protein EDB92DRAFT_1816526 [Lactarius akahatsu]|uniref:Uncharacterized protein n=1 Tax=Lactarius akahatsu TaxID=416441 RepID=A0AAD4LEX9_9AGAM|nr:hypothetical protein EDB92DRAFT_1816526 [Lactarius akahatsu]
MTTERLHIPVPSPDPATAEAFVTSCIVMPHATPATSTSPLPLSFTSSPTAVAVQHNPELLAQSDLPNLPYSAFVNPVLDNTLSTGPPPSSHLPMTQSDLSPSCQESHHSLTATAAPSAPPWPTFAPDMGAATEDNASSKPSSRKENDALDPPSVNRAITVTLDLLPQFPSLPLVTDSDVAIAGPSLREHAGDHSPHPPHLPHDIV